MSQKVHDILNIYKELLEREEQTIPVFTKEEFYSLFEHPAFICLMEHLNKQTIEVDVQIHGYVEDADWEKASRANGELAGLTMVPRWMIDMKEVFRKLDNPDEEED